MRTVVLGLLTCFAAAVAISRPERAIAAETAAAVATKSPLCHPDDELWILSTRSICNCPDEATTPHFKVTQFDGVSHWPQSDLDSLLKAMASKRTMIWVHGNRIDASAAVNTGWEAYRAFGSGGRDGVRLITWSWPSDQIHGQLKDIRAKTSRSHVDAAIMAWFLRRVPVEAKVDLVGYSLGPRIITGGLQGYASRRAAEVAAPAADGKPAPSPRFRAVLLCAAIDNHWLLPGEKHGQVLTVTDSLFSLHNSCDRVLKWYPRAVCGSTSLALGYTGLACPSRLGELAPRYSESNVSGMIGKVHDWQVWLRHDGIMAQVRGFLHE
jgi:hypothetical protein